MPLSFVNSGQEVKVLTIHGPETNRMRLVNMGITAGIPLRVISRSSSSMLIGVRETRLMVDTRLAHQIICA